MRSSHGRGSIFKGIFASVRMILGIMFFLLIGNLDIQVFQFFLSDKASALQLAGIRSSEGETPSEQTGLGGLGLNIEHLEKDRNCRNRHSGRCGYNYNPGVYQILMVSNYHGSTNVGDLSETRNPAAPNKNQTPQTLLTHPAFPLSDFSGDGSELSMEGFNLSTNTSSHSLNSESENWYSQSLGSITHVVSTNGDTDYSRIREAIDAAAPGDVIVIKTGIYRENLTIDKSLEIRSEGGHSGEVVVSAFGNGPVMTTSPGVTVKIKGLSLYGGNNISSRLTIGPSVCYELADVCIGWGFSKAGKINIEYDGSGRVIRSENVGFVP